MIRWRSAKRVAIRFGSRNRSPPIRSSRNPPDSYCSRLCSETLIQSSSLRILSVPSMARKFARAFRRSCSPHRRCFYESAGSYDRWLLSERPLLIQRQCPRLRPETFLGTAWDRLARTRDCGGGSDRGHNFIISENINLAEGRSDLNEKICCGGRLKEYSRSGLRHHRCRASIRLGRAPASRIHARRTTSIGIMRRPALSARGDSRSRADLGCFSSSANR